ncbi:hypothetical protein [Legionella israelensis]|uniref:Uncharacterized protein n=1 Tax=Legionella israelensis TaxID=454 RepID=A0A0W0VIV4_9GAMM|nr:hypothetical protein [Legionella israelensis]KTD20042.1 hypothetical protein Lisr_1892 [Legionella israelensis]QBS11220.1 hypothetical protein E4T55_15015 [Legionella israelensis]SCY57986.1 hypothetical protein SAMN02746069_02933 [Legionella israelensis DSM 19235]STX61041.1 Uncharacterised protein [Legionella israelensis]
MSWNKKLKQLLLENNLTPSSLSKLTHISVNTIKAWLAPGESSKYRTLSHKEFVHIHSVITINKVQKEEDKEHYISSNTYSAEYHLENGLRFLEDFLSTLHGYDDAKVKDVLSNLNRAHEDICLANRLIMNCFPSQSTSILEEMEIDGVQ